MTNTDWAIPQQGKLKYTQLFNLHDRGRTGFLTGLQCRGILMQSGLPRNILAEIWNLSDIDGDGQLTREEFILAMHLTSQVRSGNSLPTELPSELIPPSYRKPRSISATSIHSTASAASSTSSGGALGSLVSTQPNDDGLSQKSTESGGGQTTVGSILSTNTFEDKRRENFEKGRAELERRRLKMIESQISVLSEQFVSGKKQVAEAKAKIDAMRSDRDSKAGLITSLEAQLQTVRDREAYLRLEEQNLIAIAKDLNLVNSAQSIELDQQACKNKEESIRQMKEKLADIQKEKEEKEKLLTAAEKTLENSREELKSLSDEVCQTYQRYKDKLELAKVKKEQLMEQNKSETIQLDATWDPVFTTPHSTTNSVPSELRVATNPVPAKIITATDFVPSKPIAATRYRAIYAFEARNPDELTINPGDIITGIDGQHEPGWLMGELHSQRGLFPEAFVEQLAAETISSSSGQQLTEKATKAACETDWPFGEPIQAEQKKTIIKYKVIYAFEARNPDELTINPGDIITGVDGQHEPGWLMGELGSQRGLFPEAYVEQLAAETISSGSGQQSTEQTTGKSRGKKAEVATVIANYRALGQEQLNLEKGQLVLIRRKMDSGWWEGELQIKGYILCLRNAIHKDTRANLGCKSIHFHQGENYTKS